ncbi:MAG: extracellular solute-binding protein [Lachnospiraceae bacterium]|nr:extracellular solute-binding protein [Lachnospiraceae bacterium]
MKRKGISLFVAASMVIGLLSGCGGQNDENQEVSQKTDEGSVSQGGAGSLQTGAGELASITFFGTNANSGSGRLTGGLGKFFEDRGLSVEVVPYSSEKLQAQLASGELADVIWLPQQEMLTAAEGGLIIPLDDYLDQMPNITAHADLFDPFFEYAREYNSNGTGNVYYIGMVGPSSMNVVADTERFAIKMNWGIYAEAGYPEFGTLEDSVEVFKAMKETRPQTEDGIPTYAMNLFSDFDTDHFWNILSVYCLLGKSETYLGWGIEYDVRTQSGTSMFDDGSTYYRALKYMYDLNQAGLIDPDSLSQTRSTAWEKIKSGAALAGWAGDPGLESDGYYPVVFDEFIPTYNIASSLPAGGYCISSSCDNVDAALRFLDILANEEDLLTLVSGYPGDEMRWNYDDNGVPTITETFARTMADGTELNIPADQSIEYWNITYLINSGYLLDVGTSYNFNYFPSYYDYLYSSDLAKDWTEHYGYTYLREMLDDKNWTYAEQTEGFSTFLTPDDDAMIMTKAALKDVIVPASWRMVFATSEDEFNSIWKDMKAQCESLGIDDVIQYKLDDIANARAAWASLNNS